MWISLQILEIYLLVATLHRNLRCRSFKTDRFTGRDTKEGVVLTAALTAAIPLEAA